MSEGDRWPPVAYDAEGLKKTIRTIFESSSDSFYSSLPDDDLPMQGDVVRLNIPLVYVDASGMVAGVGADDNSGYWLVCGNSCDFSNHPDEWTHVVPLQRLEKSECGNEDRWISVCQNRINRRVTLPPWDSMDPESVRWCANLTEMMPIEKAAVERAERAARVSRIGWVLIHCCIVRHLCRDDGRFDVLEPDMGGD